MADNILRPTFGKPKHEEPDEEELETQASPEATPLADEEDYEREDREDLLARLMGAQQLGQFLFRAYDVLQTHGVCFKTIPEWKGVDEMFRKARRLRPNVAQVVVVSFFERLNHALTAAIRRKQFKQVEANEGGPEVA